MDTISDDLKTKVVKQLEYYFSDFNLIKDSFLRDLIIKDNGWISFETFFKFNRLKKLVDNNKDLLTNVFKSVESDLIEFNVNEEKLRLKSDKPLPEITDQLIQSLKERTVHVKGFPKETTEAEVMNWCLNYGTFESIEMRYKKKKKKNEFKGCVFITFADKSMADKMINETVLKFKDNELLKENKLRYYERRVEFIEEKRREKDRKRAQRSEEDIERLSKPVVVKINKNLSVLKVSNVPKELSNQSIREFFGKYFDENKSKVNYVLKINTKEICFIRFYGKSSATDVLAKMVSIDENSDQSMAKVSIDGKEVIVEQLTEEEEKKFWKKDRKRVRKWTVNKNPKNKIEKIVDKKVKKLKNKPILVESAILQLQRNNWTDSSNSRRDYRKADSEIRSFYKKYANIVDIENIGNAFTVRFANKCDAKNVLAVTKRIDESTNYPLFGFVVIGEEEYFAKVLSGEEEKKFWINSIDKIERKAITQRMIKKEKQRERRIQRQEMAKQSEEGKQELANQPVQRTAMFSRLDSRARNQKYLKSIRNRGLV